MKKNKLFNFICIICFVFVLVCNIEAKIIGATAASVNGKALLQQHFDVLVESTIREYELKINDIRQDTKAINAIKQRVLIEMLTQELLYQDAVSQGLELTKVELNSAIEEVKGVFKIDVNGKPLSDKEANEAFKEELKQQRLTEKSFEERIEKQALVRKHIQKNVMPLTNPVQEKETRQLFVDVNLVLDQNKEAVKSMEPIRAQEAIILAGQLHRLTAEQAIVGNIFIANDFKNDEETAKKKKVPTATLR